MTRTMVYLPEDVHRGLKHLAVERRSSLAKLVREAVELMYAEDLEDLKDLRIVRKRLRDLRRHPERAIPFRAYREKRAKH